MGIPNILSAILVYSIPSEPKKTKDEGIKQEQLSILRILGLEKKEDTMDLASFIELVNKLTESNFISYDGRIQVLNKDIISNSIMLPLKLQIVFSKEEDENAVKSVLKTFNALCSECKFSIEKILESTN